MLDRAKNLAIHMLDSIPSDGPTEKKQIESIAHQVFSMFGSKANFELNDLIKKIESQYAVKWEESSVLQSNANHEEWLPLKRSDIKWEYWERYRTYLNSEKGWSTNLLKTLDVDTDKVLAKMEDPDRDGPWYNKGLVVGDVQSGKTAHFTAVLNKSVDAGYRLIIVLGGIHNSLRSQTQLRLDRELVGYNSQDQEHVGVGDKKFTKPKKTIQTYTNSAENGDLSSRSRLSLIGNEPILLVIKKNKTPLLNLIEWLKGQKENLKNIPALIIDDEADQASVNTADPELDPTTTNRLIREMADTLYKKNYIGYTATAFANIFINPDTDDLFPKDFIFRLKPPSNYIGASRIFGLQGDTYADIESKDDLKLLVEVTDQEGFLPRSHRSTFVPSSLPSSLEKALYSYLISCSIRALRSGDEHSNTMLIHVTRFTTVQDKVTKLVFDWLNDVKQILRYDSGTALKEFHNIIESNFKEFLIINEHIRNQNDLDERNEMPELGKVLEKISKLVDRFEVKQINGSSEDSLKYLDKKGVYYIAIGGNKLSRGLTLDGLSISYYLRHSQAYDTLLQMGRWFGYRNGYLDLCRIFTNKELSDAYKFIALASEELNREFEKLEKTGGTPDQWAGKVRRDPSGLIMITAPNKMRLSEKRKITFSGRLVQTLSLSLLKSNVENNYKAFQALIENLNEQKAPIILRGRPILKWDNISVQDIASFFNLYKSHFRSPSAETSTLKDYILKSSIHGELINWTVVVVGASGDKFLISKKSNIESSSIIRKTIPEIDTVKPAIVYKGITNKEDESLDLENIENKSNRDSKLQRNPQNGLLILYPISSKEIVEQLPEVLKKSTDVIKENSGPIIGFAISFPVSDFATPNDYNVNRNFLKDAGFDDQEIVEDEADEY